MEHVAVAAPEKEISIRLDDPGMTALHRAGLAGLWMTLECFERDGDAKRRLAEHGGRWVRANDVVTFVWGGDGRQFFSHLIQESFQLTSDGRFWFPALGSPDGHNDLGTTLQGALLNTFLQHGKNRSADPSTQPSGAVVLDIEGSQTAFSYRRVRWYAHQRAALEYRPDRAMAIAGWQMPGGIVRHSAFSASTALSEAAAPSLALLFAPVGALYFRIRKRTGHCGRGRGCGHEVGALYFRIGKRTAGVRPQYCLVIPEIDDLALYARARRMFLNEPVSSFVAAGPSDAGLRVLAELEAAGLLRSLRSAACQVFAFGTVPWATQLKTRIDRSDVRVAREDALRFYSRARSLLPPLPQQVAGGAGSEEADGRQTWWETSPLMDLIARNIVAERPWYSDFGALVSGAETRSQFVHYEIELRKAGPSGRKGVAAVVALPEAFENEPERIIVEACHEAWRRRLGALADRARERGEAFGDLANRERERLRIAFSHCKNGATLRMAMTDFWSRAGGSIPQLQEGWKEVLPYFREDRWQVARDLALLALASYAAPEDDPNGSGNGA